METVCGHDLGTIDNLKVYSSRANSKINPEVASEIRFSP